MILPILKEMGLRPVPVHLVQRYVNNLLQFILHVGVRYIAGT